MPRIVRSIYTQQALHTMGLVDLPPSSATAECRAKDIVGALERQRVHQVGDVSGAYKAIDGSILFQKKHLFCCNLDGGISGDQSFMPLSHFDHKGLGLMGKRSWDNAKKYLGRHGSSPAAHARWNEYMKYREATLIPAITAYSKAKRANDNSYVGSAQCCLRR